MILFSQIHTPKLFVSVSRDLPPFTSMNTYEHVNNSRNPAIHATLRTCSSWNDNLASIMGEDMFILDQSLSIITLYSRALSEIAMGILLSIRDQLNKSNPLAMYKFGMEGRSFKIFKIVGAVLFNVRTTCTVMSNLNFSFLPRGTRIFLLFLSFFFFSVIF